MKNFISVKNKIKLLSHFTGLPVYYAGDLRIHFDSLSTYEGNRFLLILRTSGAQLCLLDNQTDEYHAQKLSEFKFYYAQCRDAQFYYYDGANLAAIDPLKALKKIARGHERFDASKLHLELVHGLAASVKELSVQATVQDVWSTEDVEKLIERKHYVFRPALSDCDKIAVLKKMKEDYDANIGFNWDALDNALLALFADRLVH